MYYFNFPLCHQSFIDYTWTLYMTLTKADYLHYLRLTIYACSLQDKPMQMAQVSKTIFGVWLWCKCTGWCFCDEIIRMTKCNSSSYWVQMALCWAYLQTQKHRLGHICCCPPVKGLLPCFFDVSMNIIEHLSVGASPVLTSVWCSPARGFISSRKIHFLKNHQFYRFSMIFEEFLGFSKISEELLLWVHMIFQEFQRFYRIFRNSMNFQGLSRNSEDVQEFSRNSNDFRWFQKIFRILRESCGFSRIFDEFARFSMIFKEFI